jgi:hypothetical protein
VPQPCGAPRDLQRRRWMCDFAQHLAASFAGSPSGTMGRDRSLIPVAAKMALLMAGAKAMMGVSPAPAGAISLRSNTTAAQLFNDAVMRDGSSDHTVGLCWVRRQRQVNEEPGRREREEPRAAPKVKAAWDVRGRRCRAKRSAWRNRARESMILIVNNSFRSP